MKLNGYSQIEKITSRMFRKSGGFKPSAFAKHTKIAGVRFSDVMFHTLGLLFIFLAFSVNTYAQRPGSPGSTSFPGSPGGFGNTNSSPQQRDSSGFDAPRDTSTVLYFYDNDFKTRRIIDTIGQVQRYNPVFLQEYGYYHLGNLGSPHRQLVYQPRLRKGVDMGFHHYDLYLKKADQLRFFNTSHPHTKLTYTAGGNQEDALTNAVFTQNINSTTNIAIDYKRIVHAGGYQNQRTRHTSIGASGWYRSRNDSYYGLAGWSSNRIKQQNNGGILDVDDLEDDDFTGARPLIPVTLAGTAQTEYDHDEFTYSHYLNLWRKAGKPIAKDTLIADSLGKRKPVFKKTRKIPTPKLGTGLSHHFRYQKEQVKFFDTNPTPDTDEDFYGIFKTNERGIRHFINLKKIENRFGAFLYLGENDAFSFQPALSHAFVILDQEPEESLMQELRVSGKLSTSIADVLNVEAYGHYELGANLGDYLLRSEASLRVGKLGLLEGQLLQHQYEPNLIQRRLFVSQEMVWETDFKKTNETNFMVKYSLPNLSLSETAQLHLSGGIQNHLINNLIYYDTSALPVQEEALKNIFQIFIRADVQMWKFRAENRFVFQQTDKTNQIGLKLPSFWSQHSVFFQDNLFKGAALVKLGVDIRSNTSFRADDWQIVTGQFYNQNVIKFGVYPVVDGFLDFKVNRFRAFFKMENISQAILQRTLIVAPNYPTRDMAFRFGLSWVFID